MEEHLNILYVSSVIYVKYSVQYFYVELCYTLLIMHLRSLAWDGNIEKVKIITKLQKFLTDEPLSLYFLDFFVIFDDF